MTWFLVAIVAVALYRVPMDTLALETVKGRLERHFLDFGCCVAGYPHL
ncbi:MAG: hypothetical protein ACOX2P_09795 [Bacillota bacterium]